MDIHELAELRAYNPEITRQVDALRSDFIEQIAAASIGTIEPYTYDEVDSQLKEKRIYRSDITYDTLWVEAYRERIIYHIPKEYYGYDVSDIYSMQFIKLQIQINKMPALLQTDDIIGGLIKQYGGVWIYLTEASWTFNQRTRAWEANGYEIYEYDVYKYCELRYKGKHLSEHKTVKAAQEKAVKHERKMRR